MGQQQVVRIRVSTSAWHAAWGGLRQLADTPSSPPCSGTQGAQQQQPGHNPQIKLPQHSTTHWFSTKAVASLPSNTSLLLANTHVGASLACQCHALGSFPLLP